ncbi:MAG TPA: vWA domain-containing protein [Polyangia bacterium]|nr:vWA domain-containing protein [Polyangia bacterium]
MRAVRGFFFAYVIVAGACNWSGSKNGNGSGSGGDSGTGSGGAGGAASGSGGAGGAASSSGGGESSGGASGNTDGGSGGALATTDGGGDDQGVDAPTCGMQTFALESTPPDLLVLLDRSGSMLQTPANTNCAAMDAVCLATTKWPQVSAAINDVVGKTETTIRWGLKVFPDTGSCGAVGAPAVGIADLAAMSIATAITDQTPKGGATPTRAAVASAADYLTALPDTNPKYILLATDGLPNCGSVNNDNLADDTAAIAAVMDSASKGIPVFVVGIATADTTVNSDATLNMMAIAGGKPQTGMPTSYYPVANKDDLVATLGMIQRKIFSCEFKLAMKPPFPDKVAVKGDGTDIPRSATAGWDYGTDQMSIVLSGSYCTDLMAGKIVNVQAIFMCVIPTIP